MAFLARKLFFNDFINDDAVDDLFILFFPIHLIENYFFSKKIIFDPSSFLSDGIIIISVEILPFFHNFAKIFPLFFSSVLPRFHLLLNLHHYHQHHHFRMLRQCTPAANYIRFFFCNQTKSRKFFFKPKKLMFKNKKAFFEKYSLNEVSFIFIRKRTSLPFSSKFLIHLFVRKEAFSLWQV